MNRALMCTALCVLLEMTAPPARACGGLFAKSDEATQDVAVSQGLLSSNGLRSALVQVEGGWDLFVQPGHMSVTSAAWVLPVPVAVGKDDVEIVPPDFLDQLEAATSPLFVAARNMSMFCPAQHLGEGGGCGEEDIATGDRTVEWTETQSLTYLLGADSESAEDPLYGLTPSIEAEFDVLEAASGTDLTDWLSENGFEAPDGLAKDADAYVKSGHRFVVARLAHSQQSTTAIPVIRVHLAGLENPAFPLALSRFSIPPHLEGDCDAFEEFHLYVAASGPWHSITAGFQPHEIPGGALDASEVAPYGAVLVEMLAMMVESYRFDFYDWASRGTTSVLGALVFDSPLTEEDVARRLRSLVSDPLTKVADQPDKWSPTLTALLSGSAHVTRFQGLNEVCLPYDDLPVGPPDVLLASGEGEVANEPGIYETRWDESTWGDDHDYRCNPSWQPPGTAASHGRTGTLSLLAVAVLAMLGMGLVKARG